jgi:HAD superfamily hydrolase (TIGR01549 family)
MLRAVTLDFWDTLFGWNLDPAYGQRQVERLADELSQLGEARAELEIRVALQRAYEWFDRIWIGEHRTPGAAETLGVVLATLAVSEPGETLARLATFFEELVLEVQPELLSGVSKALPQLAAHYRLALIVDTGFAPGKVLRELLSRHGLLDLFACAYFSDEGAWSKPDRRVFAGVLEELGVDAAEAVHVGDSARTDVAGAKAAGMLAVQVLGSASARAAPSADAVIGRFDELPAVVADLAALQGPRESS